MSEQQEVFIHGLGSAGDGVGRLADGRVVFVPRALPGDRVRVRLTRTKKQVQYGELVSLVEPSPDRVDSRCRVRGCGGCGLRELGLAGQAELKRRRVVETLRRIGGIDVEPLLGPVMEQGDGWRTRHRVRLHAAWDGHRWRLGFYARHSRDLVEIGDCPVLWSELEQAAAELGRTLAPLSHEARLEQVELAYSRREGRAAARVLASGALEPLKRWLADAVAAGLSGAAVDTVGHTFGLGNLELKYDHGRASEFDLRYEPGVFTQANPEMNDRLVEVVVEAVRPAQGQRVLELHAGIGNFSVPLRLAGVELVAVERQRRAAVLCRRNARAAGVELEVRADSDESAVSTLGDFHTVLLDPPRTGAREAAAAIAGAPGIDRVVYVACDVATLARDAALLTAGGFTVTAARAVDMFPQTPHVEVVLSLARRRG